MHIGPLGSFRKLLQHTYRSFSAGNAAAGSGLTKPRNFAGGGVKERVSLGAVSGAVVAISYSLKGHQIYCNRGRAVITCTRVGRYAPFQYKNSF